MFKILTLNNISSVGLERLPRERYEVASEIQRPDGILLRSANMHAMEVPASLKAVGRAGAGVNNIPVDSLTQRGVAVFNAPGANANAVKELVVAGMLLAARNICQSWDFARKLRGDGAAVHKQVEAGKKQFVGFELPGRTLGVIGLGSIGVQVANAAVALGMKVIGYDRDITVQRAWQLSSNVQQATSVDDLLSRADFVTFHTPLTDATRNMINQERLKVLKKGVVLLNFARDGIVEYAALREGIESGRIHAYVCDFPHPDLMAHERVIALPHIGASTREAEENCAVMVADQVRDYLEHGIIHNSVNFPEVIMPRTEGYRLAVVNANVPNMVGQISTALAKAQLNILDMLNKSRGEVAYNLVDVNAPVPESTVQEIRSIQGVLAVRVLNNGD
ncbi:MAG: 3-phosphoglycerate dehydrogenase [Chromatiales bacterium 21-64-14]|nr:MAG: 3-phosphoglycerate dehydrogenase [Chromatiales bacterium 21-64-14]HQU15377.1 phosphoglycerate dehydrogenase [Gammaproteobacteria bacterium]